MIRNFFGHLHTVNRHRFLVCRFCFRLGLYWQGLTHDLSKYSPTEFWSSVKYFQGNRSPIDAEKKAKGYSPCWLHHIHHNPHHWQHWVDSTHGQMIVYEMPIRYIKEMLADRISACIVYEKDAYHPASALEFFRRAAETQFLPPKTYALLEHYLTIVAEHEDLNEALKIIRNDKSTF